MDLRKLGAAVAAHRVVAVLGVAAAIGLAFLAQVRVDPFGSPAVSYRKPVIWSSNITLQLTQVGFPEGKVSGQANSVAGLAPLYASLATTDPVKRIMRRSGPVLGGARVDPLGTDQSALPFIKISSFAYQASSAVARVRRQAAAFMTYVARQQLENNVAPRNRVILQVASGPTRPAIVVPRKITLSVVVFLSMLIVTGGLILALENLRLARRGHIDRPAESDDASSDVREPRETVLRTMSSDQASIRPLRQGERAQAAEAGDPNRDAPAATEPDVRRASEAAGRSSRWSRSSRG